MAVKAAGNVTVTYDSNALTAYLNTTSMNAVVNQIDTTDFSSTGMESIAGLGDWSIPVGGHWDSTLHGYINPDAVTPPDTLKTLVVVITAGAAVTYTWTTTTYITEYTINASAPADGITWTATIKGSGIPTMS